MLYIELSKSKPQEEVRTMKKYEFEMIKADETTVHIEFWAGSELEAYRKADEWADRNGYVDYRLFRW